jgi:hypothetical protein
MAAARAAAGQGGAASLAGDGGEEMADAEEEEEGRELTLGGAPLAGGEGAAARALQLSLPAQLGMEPEALQRIRDGLFAPQAPQQWQPAAKQRRVLASAGAAAPPAAAAQPAGAGAAAAPAKPPLAVRNAWRKQQAAPLSGLSAAKAAAPRTPPPAAPPPLPAGPVPVGTGAAAGGQCLVPAPAPSQHGGKRCLPDAGMYGGTAFRAGWAPNGVLAHAGGRPTSAAHVLVRRVSPGARLAPAGADAGTGSDFQRRQRAALEAALKLHLDHSSPDPPPEPADAADMDAEGGAAPAADDGAPRWRLRCRRDDQLRRLTRRYIDLCAEAAAQVGPLAAAARAAASTPASVQLPGMHSGRTPPPSPHPHPHASSQAQGAERTSLRHQASTWELLHALFSAIPGEAPPGGGGGVADGNGGGGSSEGGSGGGAMAADEPRLDRLAAFKRRALLRCVGKKRAVQPR